MEFDGVQIFSATVWRDRVQLGERVTAWLEENDVDVLDLVVRQSSDRSHHCLTIVLFYRRDR